MGKRSVAIRWPFGMVRWMSVSSREMFHWILSENVDCLWCLTENSWTKKWTVILLCYFRNIKKFFQPEKRKEKSQFSSNANRWGTIEAVTQRKFLWNFYAVLEKEILETGECLRIGIFSLNFEGALPNRATLIYSTSSHCKTSNSFTYQLIMPNQFDLNSHILDGASMVFRCMKRTMKMSSFRTMTECRDRFKTIWTAFSNVDYFLSNCQKIFANQSETATRSMMCWWSHRRRVDEPVSELCFRK